MSEKKKKSLFDRAIDALTDRDEKEAAAKAAERKALTEETEKQADARAKMAVQKIGVDEAAAEKAAAQKTAANRVASMKAVADRDTAAPRKGIVTVRSLRIRADHNTSSEIVGGLLEGQEVTILGTWSDGSNTWARLDKGWAAMLYDGETYIQPA